jgi:hypothetical protein
VPIDDLEQALERHSPKVPLLNHGTLRSPSQVFTLHRAFPRTSIVVLANRPSAAECNQMRELARREHRGLVTIE